MQSLDHEESYDMTYLQEVAVLALTAGGVSTRLPREFVLPSRAGWKIDPAVSQGKPGRLSVM